MMSNSDAQGPTGADPLIGQVLLDRYRVVRKVEDRRGAGVYLADHLMADRPVAVEVLGTASAPPAAVDQFLEEARTVARIGHENVVEIINGGRSPQGAAFLALEVLEGQELGLTMRKDGPMLWDRAQGILLQLTAALGAVHRHGILHGDLRPENVLLVPRAGRRDFVKLLDFGVARLTGAAASAGLGPEYLAPEQAAGGPVDQRADVYSLGCLMYQLVTGQLPFEAATAAELLDKHRAEAPVPPSTRRPAGSLPADLDAVVLRAMEKDPAARWPDMAAFADAISRCRMTRRQSVRVEALQIAELSGKTNAFELDARKRKRRASLLSVAAAVVLASAGILFFKSAPGHVQISTTPADADLVFNGIPVQARSPVVLDANPGRYQLVVSRAGYVTAQRTVDVTALGTVSVPVDLAPVAAAPPTAAALPAPAAEPIAPPAAPSAPAP
jgi:serine/threonine protein kinase